MSERAPRSSRGNPSTGDIVRSVVVLGLIVLGLWMIGLLITSTPDDAVGDVDYASIASSAQEAAQYPVLIPSSVPEGWRANGARFRPSGEQPWHLGMLTDNDIYIGLEQAVGTGEGLLSTFAEDSEPDGTATIAGDEWQVHRGQGATVTYVREADGAATLVTSRADRAVVERYIASLSPAS